MLSHYTCSPSFTCASTSPHFPLPHPPPHLLPCAFKQNVVGVGSDIWKGWRWQETQPCMFNLCVVLFQYFSESCQPPPALYYSVVTVTSQHMPTTVNLRHISINLLWSFRAHPHLRMWLSKSEKGGLLCYLKQIGWSKRNFI